MKRALLFLLAILFLSASGTPAEEKIQAVTYSPHAAIEGCNMNMGPTGAWAWMRGYHFVVTKIEEGSPAHGLLHLGDTVTAAGGKAFGPGENDPRMTLGNAIEQAEAKDTPLLLDVLRDGKKQQIAVRLPKMGAFAPTWPENCEKSNRLLDNACRSLRQRQLPHGDIVTDGNMGTFFGGLLMLASADPTYLDGARRAAYSVADKDFGEELKCNNWTTGYGAVLLAEYYLATGDGSVLKGLQTHVNALCKGQMKSGGWGHNSPHGAYGTLNQPGVVCAMGLALAKECGMEVDPEAYEKTLWFFSRFAELGAVPYGDHFPYSRNLDSNGRNATAALFMRFADRPALSKAYYESVAASYFEREEGHTGGFFSISWGPLAAAMAGPGKFRTFMDYQKWYYNLSRTWRGGLVLLPYHEALTRFDSSTYVYFGGDFTTGGIGLFLTLPKKHLRITGAPRSVFGTGAKLSGALLQARKQYLARDWAGCDKTLTAIDPGSLKSADETHWLNQLKKARALAEASIPKLCLEMESNLTEGGPYRASIQFAGLKRAYGERTDERIQKVETILAGKSWHINEGKMYYEAWKPVLVFNFKSWVPQGVQVKRLLESVPSLHRPLWEPLSPTSQIDKQTWRSLLLAKDQALPEGWMAPGFDDGKWKEHEGIFTCHNAAAGETLPGGAIAARRTFTVDDPNGISLRVRLQTVRPAHTQVYLNGTRIVNAVRGQRGGYASIPLNPKAFSLLKKGENLLAVTSTAQGKGGNHLDVGLEIHRVPMEQKVLAIDRADVLLTHDTPETDNAMRVREAKDRMLTKIAASYKARSIEELTGELGKPVAFFRYQAEVALAGKGVPALDAVAPLFAHKDWKVRSSACNVFERVAGQQAKEPAPESMARMAKEIPALQKLLADPHHWVRLRAASTLSRMGEPARVALPRLMEMIEDKDHWVRHVALGAVGRLHTKPETAVEAALKALKQPNTAFGVPRQAVGLLKKYPGKDGGRLEALMATLEDTPQGSGGRTLHPILEMAVELDPEGKLMIPFLTAAVDGKTGISRQQANPPAKALELLGTYGEKAKSAVPVLQAILESDTKADKGRHKAVRDVLRKLGVEVAEPAE